MQSHSRFPVPCALTVILLPLLLWSPSLGCRSYNGDALAGAGHHGLSCSLQSDWLWLSVTVSICYNEERLWWYIASLPVLSKILTIWFDYCLCSVEFFSLGIARTKRLPLKLRPEETRDLPMAVRLWSFYWLAFLFAVSPPSSLSLL